jgi:hypothetical protein
MTCREIEERLSAYLDEPLPAEERRKVEEHLASCRSCARVLADLRKTVGLVRGLGEVEPPPWLRQNIMTRVREDAAPKKKGILKTLFFPLHIKVPIQAFAMVLIAVLAFQVYRTGEPERQAQDLPLPPPRVEQKAAAPGAAPASRNPPRFRSAGGRGKGGAGNEGRGPVTADRRQAGLRRNVPVAPHRQRKKRGSASRPRGTRCRAGTCRLDRSPRQQLGSWMQMRVDSAPGGKSQVQGQAAEALREAGGGIRVKRRQSGRKRPRIQPEGSPGILRPGGQGGEACRRRAAEEISRPAPIADIVLRATDTSTAAAVSNGNCEPRGREHPPPAQQRAEP